MILAVAVAAVGLVAIVIAVLLWRRAERARARDEHETYIGGWL